MGLWSAAAAKRKRNETHAGHRAQQQRARLRDTCDAKTNVEEPNARAVVRADRRRQVNGAAAANLGELHVVSIGIPPRLILEVASHTPGAT